jgi:hypothetical protein
MRNPDKWIRKAFADLIVDNNITTVWDMNVTTNGYPKEYIILSSQSKSENVLNKCGSIWDCTILIDIVTRYNGAGNTGSRLRVNDIEDELLLAVENISIEGFTKQNFYLESSDSQDSSDNTQNIYRQLLRYRMTLVDEL